MYVFNQAAREIHEDNTKKGWWPGGPGSANVGETLMLVVTELAEAMEDYRDGGSLSEILWKVTATPDSTLDARLENGKLWYMGRKGWAMAEFPRDIALFRRGGWEVKPDGFPVEIADAVIRLLDLAAGYEIDIDAAIMHKLDFNRTRPHKHGGRLV